MFIFNSFLKIFSRFNANVRKGIHFVRESHWIKVSNEYSESYVLDEHIHRYVCVCAWNCANIYTYLRFAFLQLSAEAGMFECT